MIKILFAFIIVFLPFNVAHSNDQINQSAAFLANLTIYKNTCENSTKVNEVLRKATINATNIAQKNNITLEDYLKIVKKYHSENSIKRIDLGQDFCDLIKEAFL